LSSNDATNERANQHFLKDFIGQLRVFLCSETPFILGLEHLSPSLFPNANVVHGDTDHNKEEDKEPVSNSAHGYSEDGVNGGGATSKVSE